jgi:L-aminopeptidase/D-esterase-like protein
VQGWLATRGIGFEVAGACVPIVPQAILFDLANGGDKSGDLAAAYLRLGHAACETAAAEFPIGSVGAGHGATTATLRGGLGSASARLDDGTIVGALVAANPVGTVTVGDTQHFRAGAEEIGSEYGGHGLPQAWPDDAFAPRLKGEEAGQNTTIAVVATNARLDKRGCHRLAIMAQTGLARAIFPVHTPLDGDTVFALATGDHPAAASPHRLARLGAAAALVLARAVARAVFEAAPAPPSWTGPPAYRTRFGSPRTPLV